MTINIYDKQIIGPPKCGSRFLNEIWGRKKVLKPGSRIGSSEWEEINHREYVDLFDMVGNPLTSEVKWIVLREPKHFMETAIHTEFINGWNRDEISLNELSLINDVIAVESQSHWHRQLFKNLYLFGLTLPQPPTIVMLEDLNDFLLKEIGIEKLPIWEDKKYNFSSNPIWVTKSELILYLSNKYPKQWEVINTLLKTDEFFWNKMKEDFSIWGRTINEDTKKFSLKNDLAPQPPRELNLEM